jgi:rare lipoprotein A
MKKFFVKGLTLSALTALGTPLLLGNSQQALLATGLETVSASPAISSTAPVAPRILVPQAPEASFTSLASFAQADGRLAVVLRLRNIPVITFIGSTAEFTAFSAGQSLVTTDSAMGRAQAIAAQLEQLVKSPDFDAQAIQVRRGSGKANYQITYQQQVLVTLDGQTLLPGQTRNLGQNALQMANRLRRLLGDAPPLAQLSPTQPQALVGQAGSSPRRLKSGVASWYGPGFHGRRTANGERFNQHDLTAAHRSLPFGTRVRVTNLRNGQSVVVRINDRGPFSRGRVIDLSAQAARLIGVHSTGVAPVALDILSQ